MIEDIVQKGDTTLFFSKATAEFKPHKAGLRKVLGDLEADIMETIWNRGTVSVREVYEQLRLQREIAYTTVMTIMGRLAQKNLLNKETQGNAYIYTPALSKAEFSQRVVNDVLDGLLEDFAEPAMSHLIDRLSAEDEQKIERLEALIKARRAQGGK